MGRYDISKGSEESEERPVKKTPSIFPEYIEETETLVCFDTSKAEWYVKVKCGEKDWANVTRQVQRNGYWQNDPITFETRIEAEEWCKEKGLI